VQVLSAIAFGTIRTGTFVVNEAGGDETLLFDNIALDASSSITETGAQKL
jgi:hypothetical protein